ncbi:MAG: sulfite exporter TauE/SafE family protein [Methanospirillum sp.]|uniref:sulfite exporter TauE/SafE family protein n=1 Tax=Methanospirillum sp. TaxID=45200 RepID=UPI00236B16CA|nr:sulfite exporter TauE/SafE family protein [Methanospirillum sp.]MDD1728417.1 sulfite exporter TauE/SafE family protein [Methanospirillum sp.]
MEPVLVIIGILLVCGIIAGFLSGLLGVGGGLFMVPVIFILLSDYGYGEYAMLTAVATSAAVILPTSVSGTFRQWRMKNICWHTSLILGTGGIIGSFFGSMVSLALPGEVHVSLFAFFLLFLAFWMVFNKSGYLGRFHLVESGLSFGFFGFIVGTASGMFGIGGGMLLIPVLTIFFGYTMFRSVGISLAAMVLTSGGSVCSYILLGWGKQGLFPYSLGYVNLFVAGVLLCTSVPAAQAGAIFSSRIQEKMHLLLFTAMLLVIAFRMLLS